MDMEHLDIDPAHALQLLRQQMVVLREQPDLLHLDYDAQTQFWMHTLDMFLASYTLIAETNPASCSELLASTASQVLQWNENKPNLTIMNKCISCLWLSIGLVGDDHLTVATRLGLLGSAYISCIELTQDPEQTQKCILVLHKALELAPANDTARGTWLGSLAIAYQRSYEQLGELADIEKAIQKGNVALDLFRDDEPDKHAILNNLGNSHQDLYGHLGDVADATAAVRYNSKAVELARAMNKSKPAYLDSLGNAYLCQYQSSKQYSHVDKALEAMKEAIKLCEEGHTFLCDYLNNLGRAYQHHFECVGKMVDIEHAITMGQRAMTLGKESLKLPVIMKNLATSYKLCFEHRGKLSDITKAISLNEEAMKLTPVGSPVMPDLLSAIGTAYQLQFEYLRRLPDIELAITSYQQAIPLVQERHRNRSVWQRNLAHAYQSRFEYLAIQSDIEHAISISQDLLTINPLDVYTLDCLASAYSSAFEKSKKEEDINKAIEQRQKILNQTFIGHPDMPYRYGSLGTEYALRFLCLEEAHDNEEAIRCLREAVRLSSDDDVCKALWLNNLGNAYLQQSRATDDISNLFQAAATIEMAVNITPTGHALRPPRLESLAHVYQMLYHRTQKDDPSSQKYLLASIQHYKDAACSFVGVPSVKIDAALKWAEMAQESPATIEQCLDAYVQVFELLPEVVWLGQTIDKQYEELSHWNNVATKAAFVAIGLNDFKRAVEWLEQGHSVVWNQLLSLRPLVEDLALVNPELASELESVGKALISVASSSNKHTGYQHKSITELEQALQSHHHLAERWKQLLTEIRDVPGFKRFLKPKSCEELMSATLSGGSVILVNMHEDACDALALMEGCSDVIHIPLNMLSLQGSKRLQEDLHKILAQHGLSVRGELQRLAQLISISQSEDHNMEISKILQSLWTDLVEPILGKLGHLGLPKTNLPHVWWCVTGPLWFLPIHAAGIYNVENTGPKILDHVVSSFIPTVTSLLNGRTKQSCLSPPQLLAIYQPETPGQSPLPGVAEEWNMIKREAELYQIKHSSLGDSEATVEKVLKALEAASWVHIACHGIQDSINPIESAFVLHDKHLKLVELIQKPLQHADFAFLSACQTATGDLKLSEQAVHLAAGMLFAGYRGVIATMWSMYDEAGPKLATEVYSYLFSAEQTDTSQAAYALHHAVQTLQKQHTGLDNRSFLTWVPFIHIGV